MTLRHLKVFTAVCEYGSITRAAEKLYMTQPAVSLSIRELEEHYGVRLFDRLARRLQITVEGARLREYAVHIVDSFMDMERAMTQADPAGEVRIGSSLTIGACLLPDYMRRLSALYPGIKPRVMIDNSDAIAASVQSGNLDIGLVEGTVERAALTVRSFMRDSLTAVCPPGHPFALARSVSLEDFLAEPLLLRERGSGTRELFQSAVALLGKRIEPAWESVSTTALIRAVEAGRGVSVLPEKLAAESLAGNRIRRVPLDRPALSREFYLIYHRNKYLSAGMRGLIDLVLMSGRNGA